MIIDAKDGTKFDFDLKDVKSLSKKKFLDKYSYLKDKIDLSEAYKTLKK